MFHYSQVPSLDLPPSSYLAFPSFQPRKPSINFCLAYAKGNCSHGENCTHYHIDLSNLHCKFHKRGYCKFGSNCLFKHDSFPLKDPGYCELSPVIQQTVKENLEMKHQLTLCNSKILDLEKAIKEHAAQLSEIRGHLHTHKTPQHPVATEMVRKPPISGPPNTSKAPKKPTLNRSTLTIPNLPLKNPLERPAEQKSKLPWIKSAVRISQKRPKLRKPLHFTYQQHTIDFSLISETEKVVKTRPPTKTEVNPCFHSTNFWKVLEEDQEDLEQPAPTIPICPPPRYLKEPYADREEKLIKLEQLFTESWNELLASFNEVANSLANTQKSLAPPSP